MLCIHTHARAQTQIQVNGIAFKKHYIKMRAFNKWKSNAAVQWETRETKGKCLQPNKNNSSETKRVYCLSKGSYEERLF